MSWTTNRNTGYMSLPLPVVGNLYAPTSDWANLWWEPETGPSSMDGRFLSAPTYTQRGTPAIYWATLWNRCLAIIDEHNHQWNPAWLDEDVPTGTSGVKVLWGGLNAYKKRAHPFEKSTNGRPKYRWSAFYISGDLDFSKSPYDTIAQWTQPGYHIENLYQCSFYSNPVNETQSLWIDNTGDWNDQDEWLNLPPSIVNTDYNKRGAIFERQRYNQSSQAGVTTVEGEPKWDIEQITHYNYMPSRSLCWNPGSQDGLIAEIVTNQPGGAVLGAWKYMAYDTSLTDADGNNTGAQIFQMPDAEGTWEDGLKYVGGFYYKNSERPFVGILDKGHYRFSGWDLSDAVDNNYFTDPAYWGGRTHIRWDNSTATQNATIGISDMSMRQDHRLEIPRPRSLHMVQTPSTLSARYLAPLENQNSWFYSQTGAIDVGVSIANYSAMQCGKIFLVSDIKGNASTYNINIEVRNLNWQYDDIPMKLKWYNAAGVLKEGSWTSAGGWTGDVLSITQNYGSVMLVKSPFFWEDQPMDQTHSPGSSVTKNNLDGGDSLWFAYFTE